MSTSFREDAKSTAQFGCLSQILVGMFFLAMLVIGMVMTGANLAMLPWVRQQETSINRSSQGYVEAHQTVLLKHTQDAYRLQAEIGQGKARGEDTRNMEAQFKASLDAIEKEATTLDPQYIPSQTRTLMNQNGRGL